MSAAMTLLAVSSGYLLGAFFFGYALGNSADYLIATAIHIVTLTGLIWWRVLP